MADAFLERLGMRHPIIQAPMAGVSTPAMASAVSNAGALGSIGVGAVNADQAREMIRATRALTDEPFLVNVFCHQPAVANEAKESAWIRTLAPHFEQFAAQPPRRLREIYTSFVEDDAMLQMFLEERPAVVSFHFGLPPAQKIEALRAAGIILFATATNLDEGRATEQAGIDAVVAQGYEAGGHRGAFDPRARDECLGTFALTRLLASELTIPVIAAGGIMDGAGIVASLKLGAIAAQLGTAFIACPESSADAGFRATLMSSDAEHTVMTAAISGRPARCIANRFTEIGDSIPRDRVPDYPIAYDIGKQLHGAASAKGEFGYGAQWAGQAAPLARELPASELVAQLAREMRT